MKKTLSMTIAALVLAAQAGATSPVPPAKEPVSGKLAFEGIKGLAGTWEGAGEKGAGAEQKATVSYRVTAGGSVVEETLFPGTPHEMVTMYHMDGEDRVLTHYCAAGNQPHMKLDAQTSTPKELHFAFAGGSNVTASSMHMHEAKLSFIDADHLEGDWTAFKDGKALDATKLTLTRKK
jgi:hypothetical protein